MNRWYPLLSQRIVPAETATALGTGDRVAAAHAPDGAVAEGSLNAAKAATIGDSLTLAQLEPNSEGIGVTT